MKREFTLPDGRQASIEIDEELVERVGAERANELLEQGMIEYKKRVEEEINSKSQEQHFQIKS